MLTGMRSSDAAVLSRSLVFLSEPLAEHVEQVLTFERVLLDELAAGFDDVTHEHR